MQEEGDIEMAGLNLSTAFKPRTYSQNTFNIDDTLNSLTKNLQGGPQNAFSQGMMNDLAGQTLESQRLQDQDTIAGAQQAQTARGVAGPNLGSVYKTQMEAKNRGGLGNAMMNANLQGMQMGNQQFANTASAAGTLGGLESQQLARELTMILNNVRPEIAGQGMQIDPYTGLPLASGLGAPTSGGGATSGTSTVGAGDPTGYYTTGNDTAAMVPWWIEQLRQRNAPDVMRLENALGIDTANNAYQNQLGLNQQGQDFNLGTMGAEFGYNTLSAEQQSRIASDFSHQQSAQAQHAAILAQQLGIDTEQAMSIIRMAEAQQGQGFNLQTIGAQGDQDRANMTVEGQQTRLTDSNTFGGQLLSDLGATMFSENDSGSFLNPRTEDWGWNILSALLNNRQGVDAIPYNENVRHEQFGQNLGGGDHTDSSDQYTDFVNDIFTGVGPVGGAIDSFGGIF